MIALECRHILTNGQKCRCAALRGQPFCFHHAAKSILPGLPPLPKRQQYSRLARWRRLGQTAAWLDPAEIPVEILGILESLLGQNGEPISDLAAGRYLRALLRRLGSVPFAPPQESGPEQNEPEQSRPEASRPEACRLEEPSPTRHAAPATATGPQPLPFPRPARPSAPSSDGPTAQQAHALHAAFAEVFANGRPQPGQKIDPKKLEHLSRAFIRHGLVPPELAPKSGRP